MCPLAEVHMFLLFCWIKQEALLPNVLLRTLAPRTDENSSNQTLPLLKQYPVSHAARCWQGSIPRNPTFALRYNLHPMHNSVVPMPVYQLYLIDIIISNAVKCTLNSLHCYKFDLDIKAIRGISPVFLKC